jgi:hypothetical protein
MTRTTLVHLTLTSLVVATLAGLALADVSSNESRPCYSKTFGTPRLDGWRTLKVRGDNSTFVGGSTFLANGDQDALVMLLDPSGNVSWSRTYGGPGHEQVNTLWPTPDGGAILGLRTASFPIRGFAPTFWLIKIDGAGDVQWQRVYGLHNLDGDILSLQALTKKVGNETVLDGYVLSGKADGVEEDGFIVRLDPAGSYVWGTHVGQPDVPNKQDYDEAWRVAPAKDGGFIVVGWSSTEATVALGEADRGGWLLKLNETGARVWHKILGDPMKWEELHWVMEMEHMDHSTHTMRPMYVVTGYAFGPDGTRDAYVAALDAEGDMMWQKMYTGPYGSDDIAFHLHHVDRPGGGMALLLAGATGSLNTMAAQGFVAALDHDGSYLWGHKHAGPYLDGFRTVENVTQGGPDPRYLAAGYTRSAGAGDMDGWVVGFGWDRAPVPVAGSPIQVTPLGFRSVSTDTLPPPVDALTANVWVEAYDNPPQTLDPTPANGFHQGVAALQVGLQGTC